MVQKVKNKPVDRGFKVFCICDSRSTYLCNFEIYSGKTHFRNEEESLPRHIVKKLCAPYKGKGHLIYMDRYFTIIPLFLDLKDMKIGATGTVSLHRKGIPKDLIKDSKEIPKNHTNVLETPSLTLIQWKDNTRIVNLLSSVFDAQMQNAKRRFRVKDDLMAIPEAILHYNKNAKAVDTFDKLLAYHNLYRKSFKWWKPIFAYLLLVCMLNAYIIYKKVLEKNAKEKIKPLNREEFILSIAESLVEEQREIYLQKRKSKKFGSFSINPKNDCMLEVDDTQRDCAICSAQYKGRRKRTKYWCVTCKVHTCPDTCYDRHRHMRIESMSNRRQRETRRKNSVEKAKEN